MSLFMNVLKVGYVSLFTYALYYMYEKREEDKKNLKETLSELKKHLKSTIKHDDEFESVSESDSDDSKH